MESKGIKEISELLEAIEVVSVAIKKIAKDGKVDLSDVSILFELSSKFGVLMVAAEGIKEIPSEASDIQVEEALELVKKIYGIARAVQTA